MYTPSHMDVFTRAEQLGDKDIRYVVAVWRDGPSTNLVRCRLWHGKGFVFTSKHPALQFLHDHPFSRATDAWAWAGAECRARAITWYHSKEPA